jgi:flavin-dependent dehydrogenase
MSDLQCDVLVVGAGPAGSATAAALARAGRDVLLVESATHPRPKACAEYASPMVPRELDRLGMDRSSWQPDAVALRGMRVVHGAHAVQVGYADREGPRPAWGLEREAFDASLATHARRCGARLLERTRFEDAH